MAAARPEPSLPSLLCTFTLSSKDDYRTGNGPGHTTTKNVEAGSMSPRAWPRRSDASVALATQARALLFVVWTVILVRRRAHARKRLSSRLYGVRAAGPTEQPFGRLTHVANSTFKPTRAEISTKRALWKPFVNGYELRSGRASRFGRGSRELGKHLPELVDVAPVCRPVARLLRLDRGVVGLFRLLRARGRLRGRRGS